MTTLGRIYIATDDAGILRSDDSGKTWRDANRGFCNRRLTPLGIDESGAIYTSGSSEGADSMFFALPNGSEEWTSGQIPAKAVTMLTPSQRTSGTLYAATDRALLVSRDAGTSWRAAPAFAEAPLTALVAPRWESDAILAAAGSSIFISRDFGESWTERQFPERIRSRHGARPAMDRRDHGIGDPAVEGWQYLGAVRARPSRR